MAIIYVTGGAKSGKSKFAEDLLLSLNDGKQKNVYLATSVVFDEEMQKKVELHKARRKDNWITVESYKNFSQSLEEVMNENKKNKKNNMLVDCLTNMISNIIFENEEIDWEKPEKNQLEKCDENVEKEVQNLCEIFKNFENVVIVSNEVGMGLVPAYPLGRYFREIAGRMNQFVAEKSDEAYFVVSGISMKIK
jgi:bifunctional adenosylcobalamin biosynthesis protein CobU